MIAFLQWRSFESYGIYTYKEGGHVDIVRLLNVYKDIGNLLCTLFFFNKNKISTVNQILQQDAYAIWRILDNEEYDEIMSGRLWQKVTE
jgi:hypothetical protein